MCDAILRSLSVSGEHQRALDLLDRLGHLDAARAGLGAVEGGAAAPHAVDLVEDVEPLRCGFIAAVEDEPVGIDDRGRTEVAALVPVDRAARRAARAQDALGGVVVAGAVGLALDAFPRRRIAAGDQVRLDRPEGVEERLHVDHEVLVHGQTADRLDGDGELFARLLRQQVAHQHLARQPVDSVDTHRIGAADTVRTRPAESQGAVQVPLDVVQQVEHPVAGQARDAEALPARSVGILRVEPGDLQRHHHRAVGHRGSVLFVDDRCAHISTYAPSVRNGSAPPACSPAVHR